MATMVLLDERGRDVSVPLQTLILELVGLLDYFILGEGRINFPGEGLTNFPLLSSIDPYGDVLLPPSQAMECANECDKALELLDAHRIHLDGKIPDRDWIEEIRRTKAFCNRSHIEGSVLRVSGD